MEKVTLQLVTVELQLHSNRTKVKQPPMCGIQTLEQWPILRLFYPFSDLMVAHLQWQTTIKIRYQGDRSISSCQHTHAISFAWNFRQSGDIFGKRVFQGEVYLWCSLDRDSGGSCAGASVPTGLSSHTQIRDWFWWWIPKLRVSKTKLGTVAHSTNQNVYALLVWWKIIHSLTLIS